MNKGTYANMIGITINKTDMAVNEMVVVLDSFLLFFDLYDPLNCNLFL